MANIKLLGSKTSPFVNRAQIALNLKSVNYELLIEKPDSKSELLLRSNPVYKKIPVLIHDEKTICESLVIVQYVDEEWAAGPTILSSDPHDRATARFWEAYYDDKVFPLLRDIRLAQGKQAKLKAAEKLREVLVLSEEVFIKFSKGENFFGGNEIGYLDIALGSFLGWIKVTEILYGVELLTETKTPNLVGWAERFLSHDSVKNVIPETQELQGFVYLMPFRGL